MLPYLYPTVFEQGERVPGAGFCEGNEYGKKSIPDIGQAVNIRSWQTESSKAAWKERTERLRRMEAESIERTVSPEVPHVCAMCRDMDTSKKACKLSVQNMGSLCSLHNKHRGLIVTPVNKRQSPYMGSLSQKLDEFEKRNRAAKNWRVSTLPTFNRNDGKFLRYDTNDAGEPIRVYRDSDPRMVPEVAFSHDRTEDRSGYDECAFPDNWRAELITANGNDDIGCADIDDDGLFVTTKDEPAFMDVNDNSDIKKQCFEMPKPVWVHTTRKYYDTRRMLFMGFQTYYTQDKRTELNRVWHWIPEQHKFIFTFEERTTVVPVRHDFVVLRAEEYPTLINVQTEEWFEKDIKQEAKATGRSEDELRAENTILVHSSTVITKKDRKFFNARREKEKMKRKLTGYLILKDAKEGVAIPPKHKWPIRSKRAAAPMV